MSVPVLYDPQLFEPDAVLLPQLFEPDFELALLAELAVREPQLFEPETVVREPQLFEPDLLSFMVSPTYVGI